MGVEDQYDVGWSCWVRTGGGLSCWVVSTCTSSNLSMGIGLGFGDRWTLAFLVGDSRLGELFPERGEWTNLMELLFPNVAGKV